MKEEKLKKGFKCSMCGRATRTEVGMRMHKTQVHGESWKIDSATVDVAVTETVELLKNHQATQLLSDLRALLLYRESLEVELQQHQECLEKLDRTIKHLQEIRNEIYLKESNGNG